MLWLAMPSLLVITALWFDWLPVLRGNSEWQWPLRVNVDLTRVFIPLTALTLYAASGAWWLRRFERETASRSNLRVFLLFLTLAAPLIQLALAAGVSRVPLLEFFGPTVSVHNSGYFTTAVATPDLNQLLANYPSIMPTLPIHAQSHPPGPVIVHWLNWQFFRAVDPLADSIAMPLRTLQCHNPGLMALDNAQIASATAGMLLPLIGGLAVWPLYAFGKRVAGSKAAVMTALLFPIMPLFAMWPAQWDQIYPLLLLIGLYLAHVGLEHNSLWRIFIAGVPLSLASFFSVGNFVLMAIVGLYGAAWLWSQRESRRLSVAHSVHLFIVFALGCASIWIAYALIYGVNPIDVISIGSRLAWESTTSRRVYSLWLLWNPIDFATFLGVPIVVLLLLNVSRIVKPSGVLRPLTIATLATFVMLNLSGIVRGEVGRLWIYFGPLLALIVVKGSRNAGWDAQPAQGDVMTTTRLAHPVPRAVQPALLIGLVSLQLLTMNTRWLVNDSFLGEPPPRTPNFVAPEPSIKSYASFDHQIAFQGYDAKVSSGVVNLTLYWQALAQPPHAYTVFAHVYDANGQAVGQQDNMPVNNQLPTTCWRPGEYVSDPYTIALMDGARGPFTIEVGLYRLETGDRLPLTDGAGTSVRLQVP